MMITSSRLNYKIIGNGDPVVFLHGFLESLTMWSYLNLEDLPFMSILIDLPGHGKSLNEDDKEPSIEHMSLKVLEILLELKVTTFSIVGHSMGGYVALSLKKISLTNNKFNCQKIVLLNSNFWVDSDQKKVDRLRVAEIVFKNKELFLQTAIPNLFSDSSKYLNQILLLLNEALLINEHAIAYASLAMRNRENFTDLVKAKAFDFFVIQGEKDAIVTFDRMESEIGDIELSYLKVKNVGHMAHIQSPKVIQNSIKDFLLKCNN